MIIGLGNPGEEYALTNHNAGAIAVATFAGDASWKSHAGVFRYAVSGTTAFVIPLTFMNESGRAVHEAMKKFGADAKDLTVVHDESDLPVGQYKVVTGGSSAGHKGIQSIIDAIGTPEFRRVRIGIRDPKEQKRKKAEAFVLHAMSPDDEKELNAVFVSAAKDLGL